MIKGLYALPPDVGAYLARIGLAPEDFRRAMHPELPPSPTDYSIPHTKESLDLLVHAHLFHVPFENIDGYDLHREVSLEIPDIFDKIVTRRRGGYCFELNALFSALLEALGFSCYAVGQRVLREGSFPPVSHRVTVVTLLHSGERVLCDIAFGGPSPVTALYLDRPEVQTSGALCFRIDTEPVRGLRRTLLVEESGETPLVVFSDAPMDPVDFVPISTHMTYHAKSRFYNNRVMNLMRPGGSVAVDNDVLRLHENGVLEERPLPDHAALKQACIDYFGMNAEALAELDA